MEKYHRYIWDFEQKAFLGRFEEMYRAEDAEGFDSWQQDDPHVRDWALHAALLAGYDCPRVLDLGCGKGAFTNVLARGRSKVVGVDVAPTAIEKARTRYPQIDFRTLSVDEAISAGETFDLVTALAVLYYLSNWKDVVEQISRIGAYLYATLNFPDEPLSFIRTPDEFLDELARNYDIDFYLVRPAGRHYTVMAKSRHAVERTASAPHPSSNDSATP